MTSARRRDQPSRAAAARTGRRERRIQAGTVTAVGLCASVALVAWFGFRAARESRESASIVVQQRLDRAADLFAVALSRDMRGAEAFVIPSPDATAAALDQSDRTLHRFSSAFARYPYVESFFAWRNAPSDQSLVFFNRYDRSPDWATTSPDPPLFPVVATREPAIAEAIAKRILRDTTTGAERTVFEMKLGGIQYQFIVQMLYEDAYREHLVGGIGFTVSLPWVRSWYFSSLAEEIARVGKIDDERFTFSIIDDTGTPVTRRKPIGYRTPTSSRSFPLLFCDPLFVSVDRPADLPQRTWIVQVHNLSPALPLGSYDPGGILTLAVAVLSAAVLTLALTMTARAARASARLAELRSDFVATMTHELKTPLATIRAICDSISSGRITDGGVIKEYAQLAKQASQRLTRLVDNSLAYARVTDVADVYHFELLDLSSVLDDSLRGFALQFASHEFKVDVDVPGDLPATYADRLSLGLVFDNIIDNAVRYSDDSRCLSIVVRQIDGTIAVRFSDQGIGIPENALLHVTRKFFRVRRSVMGGTGLGLAIVQRVVEAHRGVLAIESTVDAGTTVTVTLPAAKRDHEDTHPDR